MMFPFLSCSSFALMSYIFIYFFQLIKISVAVPVLIGGREINTDGDYRWVTDSTVIGNVVPWKSTSTSTHGATILGIASYNTNWKYTDLLAKTTYYFTCQGNLGMHFPTSILLPIGYT